MRGDSAFSLFLYGRCSSKEQEKLPVSADIVKCVSAALYWIVLIIR